MLVSDYLPDCDPSYYGNLMFQRYRKFCRQRFVVVIQTIGNTKNEDNSTLLSG
jgi:hypothetical protein